MPNMLEISFSFGEGLEIGEFRFQEGEPPPTSTVVFAEEAGRSFSFLQSREAWEKLLQGVIHKEHLKRVRV